MRRFNIATLAVAVAAAAVLAFVVVSFLPLFMHEVWGPLWGAEWQEKHPLPTFGRVGPLCGVSIWPYLLATPISSLFVLVLFTVLVAVYALPRRRH